MGKTKEEITLEKRFREDHDQEARNLLTKKNPMATWGELMNLIERFQITELVQSIIDDYQQPSPEPMLDQKGYRIRRRPTEVGFAMKLRDRLKRILGIPHY